MTHTHTHSSWQALQSTDSAFESTFFSPFSITHTRTSTTNYQTTPLYFAFWIGVVPMFNLLSWIYSHRAVQAFKQQSAAFELNAKHRSKCILRIFSLSLSLSILTPFFFIHKHMLCTHGRRCTFFGFARSVRGSDLPGSFFKVMSSTTGNRVYEDIPLPHSCFP